MSNCVESCEECVRRILRFLNELRAVRSLLGKLQGVL